MVLIGLFFLHKNYHQHLYVTTTKSNSEGKFKSRVKRSIKIKQEHVDIIKQVFQDWKQNNPNEDRFRLKELYEKVNKDVVIALMRGGSWSGECLLSKPNQRADFEDNLFKVYPPRT
jgi:alcohol dehydrogenase class IV